MAGTVPGSGLTPGDPGGGGTAIEVRPAGPVPPRYASSARRALLRADPGAGTLLWVTDQAPFAVWLRRIRGATLALPSTGRPDAVTTVVLVTTPWRSRLSHGCERQLLLCDRAGRVRAAGRRIDLEVSRQLWPAELFRPLRAVGVDVTEELFAGAEEANRAHPGARPYWRLQAGPAPYLIGIGIAVVIVVIVAVAVRFG